SEEHTSELQSRRDLVCRLLLEKKKKRTAGVPLAGILAEGRAGPAPLFDAAFLMPGAENTFYEGFYRNFIFFFFNDTATTEIYTLPLHDALPISGREQVELRSRLGSCAATWPAGAGPRPRPGRKSTRLNSSHVEISYAAFFF